MENRPVVLFTNINVKIGGFRILINTPETSNSMWRQVCFEEKGLLNDNHPISNGLYTSFDKSIFHA